jgi:signal transduction histidine kinase
VVRLSYTPSEVRDIWRALATIEAIATASQGRDTTRDILCRVCDEIAGGFDLRRVGIGRCEDGWVVPVAACGVEADDLPARVRIADNALLLRARDTGQRAFVADAGGERAFEPELVARFNLTSVLAIPLLVEGSCIGFLAADRDGVPFELAEMESAVLDTAAVLAATLLERELHREELGRMDRAKTQFVALASHELRGPIQTVYGILATLHHRGDELTLEQVHELRRVGFEQGERLRGLADQLLDLSRLDAETIQIEARAVPLRRAVEQIVLLVAEHSAADVEIEIDPRLEACIDEHVLDRVVSNLLMNALRYGHAPIRIFARCEDGQVHIGVEDHGEGVAEAFAPRMFERFTRAQDRHVFGSGLGLAIAREYATAHGGDLLYHRVSPHGACFELVIPEGVAA